MKSQSKVKYLFSWDEIPGNHNEKLKEYLNQNFNIEWVKKAEIIKIDDKTIRLNAENNFLSLELDDNINRVNLIIDNVRSYEFIIKSENGKQNIYKKVPIVSFLSGKGGVGKTTFASNFARLLSNNRKILLIDCSPIEGLHPFFLQV